MDILFPPPRRPRGLSAYDHFLALCFAQLTGREGLRDLVVCLNARPGRTYQAGLAIVRKELGLSQSLHEILQVISVSVFEPVPLLELFAPPTTAAALDRQLLLIP